MSEETTSVPENAAQTAPATVEPAQNGAIQNGVARLDMVREAYNRGTLIQGEDYGLIPGTSNKPTLLKPGAQKICAMCELATEIKEIKRVWTPDHICFEVTVTLRNKHGGVLEGEGVGLCSSQERRYKNQPAPNVANTLLKMAKKRAMVDATLDATGISSLFTQDIEDMDLMPEPPRQSTPPRAQSNGTRTNGAAPAPKPKIATPQQLKIYSQAREVAISSGYRTPNGNLPKELHPGTPEKECLQRTAVLEAAIKRIEDSETTRREAAAAAEREAEAVGA